MAPIDLQTDFTAEALADLEALATTTIENISKTPQQEASGFATEDRAVQMMAIAMRKFASAGRLALIGANGKD